MIEEPPKGCLPRTTVPTLPKRNINPIFKHVKSRYLEKSRVQQQHDKMKKCDLMKSKKVKSSLSLESSSDEMNTDRNKYITLADKCFIDQLENNFHSEYTNFILNMDNRRQSQHHTYKCGPSILSEPNLLLTIHDLLKVSESPIDMLHAVFMVCQYEKSNTTEWFDPPEYKWLWLAEAIMITALMLNNRACDGDGGKDNRPESAVYWYAAGVFYGNNRCTEDAMHYLEKARTIADGPNRLIFPSVTSDLHHSMGVYQYGGFLKEPYSVWTLACMFQKHLLRQIAVNQNPRKALLTLQNAYRLLEASGEPENIPRILKAEIQFELGLKYKALGLTKLSVNAFCECARSAENIHHELDLEAKIMVAVMDPNLPENWSLLELKEEAKKRLNIRLLVKTIVAQGIEAKKNKRFEEGFHHFAVVGWLTRKTGKQNVDALDMEIALFDMAICQAERLFQMFPISKKFEPRYLVNESNQWTDPKEKHLYCEAKKEAKAWYGLFSERLNESGDDADICDDEKLFWGVDEQFSNEEAQFSNGSNQLLVDEGHNEQLLNIEKHFAVNFSINQNNDK
ncbi:uncharacterized protein LOC100572374 [Acyrthosiphon pisum]|uniref:Uncharacterized protein n=1 Tax=Acyrthosiphon pisum TaxID=7029 RepID=A0A8R1W6Q7_ACYPI|nr:uncharacterized protein LOC100572374 [Acyrthosiphon pisum]|eukprot:XP_003247081.1 PREDICTED: uncharacterized protein LOC100572374 [Acyrthosiphon pisum]